MITYVIGSLFESPAQVLVNTVNTVGVMGKGIAKDFKKIFPDMFKEYQRLCESGKLQIGTLWLYKTANKWILNFPTKTTWRKPSRIEYIESGLKAFANGYAKYGISSIGFPPLGCGNGELDWEQEVQPLMEKYLKNLPIDIFIHLYGGKDITPEHRNMDEIAAWLRSEPEALGFSEVWHDLTLLIGSGLDVRTLTDAKPFRVEAILKDEMGIRLQTEDEAHFVPYEELTELWNLIRSYGFSMDRIMPGGLEPLTGYLVALFARLPYCRPVRVAMDYSTLTGTNKVGLQWVPKPASPKTARRTRLQVRPAA